jgi:hypothetical protein
MKGDSNESFEMVVYDTTPFMPQNSVDCDVVSERDGRCKRCSLCLHHEL